MHLLLIEWGSGDSDYRLCPNYPAAVEKMEEYQQYEDVEYLEIVKAETLKMWTNPNCCPE